MFFTVGAVLVLVFVSSLVGVLLGFSASLWYIRRRIGAIRFSALGEWLAQADTYRGR